MFTELLQKKSHPPVLRPQLFPPVSDRGVWDALPGGDRWLAAGNEAARAAKKLPGLPLSLWLDFTHTGHRDRFEAVYFARRRTTATLAMAECVSGTGQFIPPLADCLWAICEETAWQLPAHNTYVRDTPQLPLPDAEHPIIDLFAAETGALLSMAYALLAKPLDAYAPGLAKRIKQTVQRRILRPYRTAHFWWMGNGEEPMCNWTPWCTQNVLLCAAVFAPKAALPAYIQQASYSLDCFVKDYGPDGCCSEGAQYYRHAALTLWGAADLLCQMAPGVFDAVWQDPQLKNMAEYIVNMHVGGPWYLNFADCSPKAGARGVREYLFGQRVGSAPLMALAAHDWAAAVKAPDPDRLHHPDDSEGINLYYHLRTALAEGEVLAYAKAAAPALPANAWYPSTGILVARHGPYVLGAKAGCNADSHNHNDVGSVTLYKNGAPLLVDVGVETYSRKTFGPHRYELWPMQSSWHNLPEFDPGDAACQQLPGARYAAQNVSVNHELNRITMDIAPAYGPVPGLGRYTRTAALTANGFALADETDYPGQVALTLMSAEVPTVQGSTVQFGDLATTAITGPGVTSITAQPVPITDPRLRQAWPDTLYRVRVVFAGGVGVEIQ